MPCKKQTDKYRFSTNSNYYNALLQYIKGKSGDAGKAKSCDDLSTSMTFSNNIYAKDICQEFKFLYKSFDEYPNGVIGKSDPFSYYDCDFLNFWLNDKLRKSVNNGLIQIKEFYKEIKNKDDEFFSKTNDLEKYMHVIDPNVLENMKLLYNLYDNAVKIISIINNEECTNEEQKSCIDHIKECDNKYKEAMDRCFNSNDDFYNALKNFKDGYKIITEPSYNKSKVCNSSEFSLFPEYDPVPEKEKRIMTIKISSTLSVLSLALPLIYKFTPFGPFLRRKINMVRNRWLNPDENESELLLSSTDIEEDISDNGEYNIGYYSGIN
ncbi:PIR Superfamily Protein [Plasmodium ovale wallikeri]|uniref:PIR Superfamily Protein n=1 Tax=Plasmodium ovale wallikeri TaxID=864142 RepID=A0A1A9ALL7_PLAOA|nr:PIR Superfamily Protein [Plasmodium ovale wallikeri]